MMLLRRGSIGILLTALLLNAAPAPAGGYSHTRDGVVIGLDIGVGWANAEYTSSEGSTFDSKKRDAISGLFRLGWARSDEFMASLDINGWDYNDPLFEHRLMATTASLTWFPGGGAFFLTGGIGSGSLSITARNTIERRNLTERGLSLLLAGGFEYRPAPDYAIGLSVNYFRVNLGDVEGLQDVGADNIAVCMHFQWYTTD